MFSKRYYEGLTSISDRDFDTLFKLLESYAKQYKVDINYLNLDTVKGGVPFSKPFLSLKKVYSIEEIYKFINKEPFHEELKIDGLAIEITYVKHQLISILTRGNGKVGSQIISRMNIFKDIPTTINIPDHFVIRGEAFIEIDLFNTKYKTTAANARSFVVSSLKGSHYLDPCISFAPYSSNLEESFKNRDEWYAYIQNLGFTLHSLKLNTKNILTDGKVYKFNCFKYIENLKDSNYHIKGCIALKNYDSGKTTRVLDLYWQMGKYGILTPLLLFEPVNIENSNIQKCSLANYNKFAALKLSRGDEITIVKRGGIIPHLESIINKSGEAPYKVPTVCSFCSQKLHVFEKEIRCINKFCTEENIKSTSFNLSKSVLNIPSISEQVVRKLNIKNEYELYLLKEENFQNILGKVAGSKIFNNLKKSNNILLNNVFMTLNIRGLSFSNIQKMNINKFDWKYLDYQNFPSNIKTFIKENIKHIFRKFIYIMNIKSRGYINILS